MTPYTILPNRTLIRLKGPDRLTFLQGLITNDLHKTQSQRMIYACLLTPQGKFLHDFFITAYDDHIVLDTEGGNRAQDLYNRLTMYCLRSDVEISLENDTPVFAILDTQLSDAMWFKDPRHPDMGYRTYKAPDGTPQDFDIWDRNRIGLCIPDGSRDMIPEKSTLLESGIDRLNGVDFEKGCYIGQELTARMHYRGLAKKHLYVIKTQNNHLLPKPGERIETPDGHLIGEMRSSCGDIGLALLKDDMIKRLLEAGYTV